MLSTGSAGINDGGVAGAVCAALMTINSANSRILSTGYYRDRGQGDPCTWSGVTCTDGHVAGLAFFQAGLAKIPSDIPKLTSPTSIDLSRNQLTSLPAGIGRVTRLNVVNNKLRALPAGLRTLPKFSGDIGAWAKPVSGLGSMQFGNLGRSENPCMDTGKDKQLSEWLTRMDRRWNEGCKT